MGRFTWHWACWQGVQLSPRGKRMLAHELAGLIKRALNSTGKGSKREGGITRPIRAEPRCGMPVLRVKSTGQLKRICTKAHSMGNK